jgi:hypothetical protein
VTIVKVASYSQGNPKSQLRIIQRVLQGSFSDDMAAVHAVDVMLSALP